MEDYNKEDVFYCRRCKSLKVINYPTKVKVDGGDIDCYCGDCNSVDIDSTNIFEWEKLRDEHNKVVCKNNNNKRYDSNRFNRRLKNVSYKEQDRDVFIRVDKRERKEDKLLGDTLKGW